MIKKTLFLFIVCIPSLRAQKIEVGVGAGVTHYKGDLNPSFRPFNIHAAGNLLARYNFNNSLSFKVGAMGGWVSGDDKKSGYALNEARGFRFRNLIVEYSGQVEYNFLNFRSTSRSNSNWTPYLFGGIGAHQNPRQNIFSGGIVRVIKHGNTPNYNIPLGIGIKKVWKYQWNFGIEFGSRFLLNKKQSDLFDGLSYSPQRNFYKGRSTPIDLYDMANTPQADKYFYTNFYISYVFYKVYCPPGR